MNVFLPLRKLQTLLICSIFMNISLLALAADPSLLIKDLGEGHCLVRVNTTQKYLLLLGSLPIGEWQQMKKQSSPPQLLPDLNPFFH